MPDSVNILQNAESLEVSPLFNTYSKVVIDIDDETQASTGTDTGRTLKLDNPLFGSATVAAKLLNRLKGYQYQPYKATKALLDPAAEIGDGISANSVYGGIYSRDRQFGHMMLSDVSAPHDEEINHEYQYETPVERKLKRQMGDVKAEFELTATQIQARVTKTGSNGSNTFAWSLDSDGFYIHNAPITSAIKQNKSALFTFTSSGLSIKGKVTATSGYIGDSTNGFEITARSIRNGMTSLSDTTHNGVYVGTDGIALGKGNFKVDSSGNLTAKSGTFGSLRVNSGGSSYSGSLSSCGGSVSSGLSYSGGSYGTIGKLDSNLNNTVSRVNTIEANYITADYITASLISSKFGTTEAFSCGSLRIGGRQVSTTTIDTSSGYVYNNIMYLGGWY